MFVNYLWIILTSADLFFPFWLWKDTLKLFTTFPICISIYFDFYFELINCSFYDAKPKLLKKFLKEWRKNNEKCKQNSRWRHCTKWNKEETWERKNNKKNKNTRKILKKKKLGYWIKFINKKERNWIFFLYFSYIFWHQSNSCMFLCWYFPKWIQSLYLYKFLHDTVKCNVERIDNMNYV